MKSVPIDNLLNELNEKHTFGNGSYKILERIKILSKMTLKINTERTCPH